jgi:putative FmdB family regulatory protein
LPLYEYKCVKCGHLFEKIESHSASTKKKCPKCGGKAERQFGAPAIQFKGSGWYVTDYAGKGSGAAPTESSGEAAPAKTAEKSDSKPAESKPAASDSSNKASSKRKK